MMPMLSAEQIWVNLLRIGESKLEVAVLLSKLQKLWYKQVPIGVNSSQLVAPSAGKRCETDNIWSPNDDRQ